MPRPSNKSELVSLAETNFEKLFKLIDSLGSEGQSQTFSFEDRDRNVRDVLVHLYEWHQLLVRWVKKNEAGEVTHFLPQPYTWKTYRNMNIKLWEKHQNTTLADAVEMFVSSHREVMSMLDGFSNVSLFTKKYYTWTGTTSLGAYCISATSSHYDWAMKKIRKHKKCL